MKLISAENNSDMFVRVAEAIDQEGTDKHAKNTVNASVTRCLRNVTVQVKNPLDRFLRVIGRNYNLFAAMGESCWVFAGRDDVEWLSRFLSRAINFSDNGTHWRGAYSRRLFTNHQIQTVVDRLRNDNDTRQAILSIYDPNRDSDLGLIGELGEAKTKDMICNLSLIFEMVDGRLNMTVFNRSQDIVWGMCSINFIEFSIIQEIVAEMVGVPVGEYYLMTTNVHFYPEIEAVNSQLQVIRDNGYRAEPTQETPPRLRLGTCDNEFELRSLFIYALEEIEQSKTLPECLNRLSYLFRNYKLTQTSLITDMLQMVAWYVHRENNTLDANSFPVPLSRYSSEAASFSSFPKGIDVIMPPKPELDDAL